MSRATATPRTIWAGCLRPTAFTSAWVAAGLCCIAGCGGATAGPTSGDGGSCSEFIVFSPDFESFRTWEAFAIPDSPEQGVVHLAGPKTDYLNKRPPAGSSEFPQGTIIVKEVDVGTFDTRQVFALVKRGCSFGSQSGAPGWEWFELKNNVDGSLNGITWRGFGPPPGGGELYGGDPHACIDCHAKAQSNDFVQSPPLQLTQF